MANGPEIAKAYVQVIPTTKGIRQSMEGAISGSATEAAEKEGSRSGESFAGAFAKALAAGTAAISAAAIKIGKEALSAYADYEQLVGGVETLFKDDGKSVMESADEAFRTAGISANEYMETVTSFSASLISSLGGDTERAAELADQAIIDMADNANKMGSSMESIQNAYQGFAKQNYTMLDNLKLGYGGTAAEMYRLMETAAELSEEFAEAANFSIDSKGHLEAGYADIVQAIHIVQEEMGIAGTTAQEAEETISGSLGMLKSSFKNLIAGMGSADADLSQLIDNVINSGNSFLTNVRPIIENIVAALPDAITGMLDAVAPMMPTILEAGVGIFQAVLDGLIKMLPDFVPVAIDLLETLVTTIIENLPMLIEAATQIITSLAQDLGENLPTMIPAIVDILLQIVETLTAPEQIDMLIETSLAIMDGLADGIIEAIPRIVEVLPEIISNISTGIVEHLPEIFELGIEIVLQLLDGIWDPEVQKELLLSIAELAGLLISTLIEGIRALVSKVTDFCRDVMDDIREALGLPRKGKSGGTVSALGEEMAQGIGAGFNAAMPGMYDGMAASLDDAMKMAAVQAQARLDASASGSFAGAGGSADEMAAAVGTAVRDAMKGGMTANVYLDGYSVSQQLYDPMQLVTQQRGTQMIR